MIKEITLGFKDQSKTVLSDVKIKYVFDDVTDKFISNEEILKEVRELKDNAFAYAQSKTLMK